MLSSSCCVYTHVPIWQWSYTNAVCVLKILRFDFNFVSLISWGKIAEFFMLKVQVPVTKCLCCAQLPRDDYWKCSATVSTRQCRSHLLVSCSSLYTIEWEYPWQLHVISRVMRKLIHPKCSACLYCTSRKPETLQKKLATYGSSCHKLCTWSWGTYQDSKFHWCVNNTALFFAKN